MLATIKENLMKAMKARNATEVAVLRVLMANLQTLEANQGSLKETDGVSAVKKLIKQNEDEIAARTGHDKYAADIERLNAENVILQTYLPTFLTADQIKAILTTDENLAQIKAAKNDGAATGVAMKLLKPHGAVEGQTVKTVVAEVYKGA